MVMTLPRITTMMRNGRMKIEEMSAGARAPTTTPRSIRSRLMRLQMRISITAMSTMTMITGGGSTSTPVRPIMMLSDREVLRIEFLIYLV